MAGQASTSVEEFDLILTEYRHHHPGIHGCDLFQQGGPKGFSPSIATRGADASVGLAFDVQGESTTSFTLHAFANIEFQVFGVGGTSWLAVASSASAAPTLSANGAANDIDVVLIPKGAGRVVANGGVRLPVATVGALPVCNGASKGLMHAVSDAASPLTTVC